MSAPRRLDFLRQIVNVALAEADVSSKTTDIVRQLVSRAELKYKFSVFGGDCTKLADYLSSREFDDVLKELVHNGYYEVAERILKKVIESYGDLESVRKAAEGALARAKRMREEHEKEKREEAEERR